MLHRVKSTRMTRIVTIATTLQNRSEREFGTDSSLEEAGFEPVWGFFCQVVFLVCWRFFVRSGKAVLRSVACDQVRGAGGRGQGTETVAKLGGLPPSELVFRSALTPEHAER